MRVRVAFLLMRVLIVRVGMFVIMRVGVAGFV